MGVIRRSSLAEEDYVLIWRFISVDNPGAADDLLRNIDQKLLLYANHPRMGTSRTNLKLGWRSFSVGNYREIAGGIELLRVLHGARNVEYELRKLRW